MACCDHDTGFTGDDPRFRRVLWAVVAINVTMFVVEMVGGVAGGSMALQADALDFLADSATYAISLWAVGQPLAVRARAALFKGVSLGALGLWVLGATAWRVIVLGEPDPVVMGGIGIAAFLANLASALLLLRWREGDANVRSVWLCSRNDAIGNLAVLVAAGGVALTATPWPDLVVAGAMAALFLGSATSIVRQALAELRSAAPGEAHPG